MIGTAINTSLTTFKDILVQHTSQCTNVTLVYSSTTELALWVNISALTSHFLTSPHRKAHFYSDMPSLLTKVDLLCSQLILLDQLGKDRTRKRRKTHFRRHSTTRSQDIRLPKATIPITNHLCCSQRISCQLSSLALCSSACLRHALNQHICSLGWPI